MPDAPSSDADAEPAPTDADAGAAELRAESGGERMPGLLGLAGRMMGVAGPVALPRRWPSAIRALRHRDYRTIWGGALVSNIGTWMTTVVKGPLILSLAGDPKAGVVWLGVDAFAAGFSSALLPLAGVIADRVDRRVLLMCTNSFQGTVAATLAVLYASDRLRVWHLPLSSALVGLAQMMAIPAYQSLMPEIVGPEDVPNAVALNSLQFNASRIIGPAIGGLIRRFGVTWNFALDAASFLAVIFSLARVRTPPRPRAAHESVLASLRGGLAYIRGRADIRVMLVMTLMGALLGAPLMTLMPALVKQTFAGSDGDYARTLSLFGAGAVMGAVGLALRSKRGPTPWRAFPMLMGLGACVAGVGLSPRLWMAQGLVVACGALFVGAFARLNTALMTSTPDRVRGRVSSFFVMAFAGAAPVGGLAGGWLARFVGVPRVFEALGGLLLLGAAAGLIVVRSRGVRYEEDAGTGVA